MIRNVKKIGDPVLRKKASKIEKITRDQQKIIDDMIETMRDQQGIGLAAPQIGVSQRIIVVELDQSEDVPGSGVVYALVNPEISKPSEEKWVAEEGCLSIPGWRGEVERAQKITVKAMNRDGQRVKLELEGWVARAMQHEVDHLDGVLYIDKLISPERIWQIKDNAKEEKSA
jgi:peptide deformylase